MRLYTCMQSPLGDLLLTSDGSSLTGLFMLDRVDMAERDGWIQDDNATPFEETKRQLAAYFSGELTEFGLPMELTGTDFQKRVWESLKSIPYGTTISYGEQAKRIGNPNASRAVGLANGKNPISIIVPCHRVIGSNGKLVGYGGGLSRKENLLNFEAMVNVNGAYQMTVMSRNSLFEVGR